jgi:xanthine dehydrogenase accessory factor
LNLWDRLAEALEAGKAGVLLTCVAGEPLGAKLLVLESGERVGDETLAPYAAARTTGTVEDDERTVLAEVLGPPLHLLVHGATDTAEALCRIAGVLGWRTTVADPRPGLATRERVPSADELLVRWPDETGDLVTPRTAVVSLVHEQRLDVPAVAVALERGAFYVGALGSRRTAERRRAALAERGTAGAERVSGPVGLEIGAVTPAEIALAIAAEIVQAQHAPG